MINTRKGFRLTPTDKDKRIAELEKENAELKKNNKMLEQGYVWHDYDAGEDCYEDTHEGKWVKRDEVYQLTKAKELIENIIRVTWGEGWNYSLDWKVKAEDFIK